MKVSIGSLCLGMFVHRLDRPWLETPYKLQGFLIKSDKDIKKLNQYCKFVYVDKEKSRPEARTRITKIYQANNGTSKQTDKAQKMQVIGMTPIHHIVETQFDDELKVAQPQYDELTGMVTQLVDRWVGKQEISLPMLRASVLPMVDSVMRNPDAFTWLKTMKQHDEYTYNHSISSSIWAAAFGRNLGLPVRDIQSLAIGGILIDIGKLKLPVELIRNPNPYNKFEFKLVQKHVDYGVEIARSIKGLSKEIISMIESHHERHNGSGYPNGLKGRKIPLFGRIAGIIDLYDAITSDRSYAKAISPHDAIRKLYEFRGEEFQPELVEQFIQVVGVYPVGTLVELSDGRVGSVVSHQPESRLRPTVMMILNQHKKMYRKFRFVDLLTEKKGKDRKPLFIKKTVAPGEYGIDPTQLYL